MFSLPKTWRQSESLQLQQLISGSGAGLNTARPLTWHRADRHKFRHKRQTKIHNSM